MSAGRRSRAQACHTGIGLYVSRTFHAKGVSARSFQPSNAQPVANGSMCHARARSARSSRCRRQLFRPAGRQHRHSTVDGHHQQ
jgi:hypothetical protein